MRSRILLPLLSLFLCTQVSSAEPARNIQCVNRMFRNASLGVGPTERDGFHVRVQDSHIAGSQELGEALRKRLPGLNLMLSDISLEAAGLGCQPGQEALVVHCEGRQLKNAFLHVKGFIRSGDISGHIDFSIPVKAQELKLLTALDSGNLRLDAAAAVELDGKSIALRWNAFFHAAPGGRNSSCQVF